MGYPNGNPLGWAGVGFASLPPLLMLGFVAAAEPRLPYSPPKSKQPAGGWGYVGRGHGAVLADGKHKEFPSSFLPYIPLRKLSSHLLGSDRFSHPIFPWWCSGPELPPQCEPPHYISSTAPFHPHALVPTIPTAAPRGPLQCPLLWCRCHPKRGKKTL